MDLLLHLKENILVEIVVEILGILTKIHDLIIGHLHDLLNNMAYLNPDHLEIYRLATKRPAYLRFDCLEGLDVSHS